MPRLKDKSRKVIVRMPQKLFILEYFIIGYLKCKGSQQVRSTTDIREEMA